MTSIDPSALLTDIQSFTNTEPAAISPSLRKSLQTAASQLAHTLQDPATAIQRLTLGQAAETAALKVALDIDLFPALLSNDTPKTLTRLSTATSTDPVLLHRLLRFLAAFHVIIEHDNDTYSLSPRCHTLGDQNFSKATNTILPLIRATMDAFPSLIQENGRMNPNDRLNGAAQKAWNSPGKELFDMVREMGLEIGQAFSVFLSVGSQDAGKVYEVYPVRERLVKGAEGVGGDQQVGDSATDGVREGKKEKVFWVDVGGGFGQCTLNLVQEFPDLPSIGRCNVQDLEPVINMAKMKGLDKTPGVEYMAHNFFEEQPIKGARTYYLRQIFHNWQDENCTTILQRTCAAMTPGYSRLLIHDIVMPERGASQWEVMMDWLMMSGYSTMERTRAQWEGLVAGVDGLRIVGIHVGEGGGEGIIEIVRD